jgi:phage regulator Rha-like protein
MIGTFNVTHRRMNRNLGSGRVRPSGFAGSCSTRICVRLPVPVELIERRIYLIRGQKVILDSELAELYQVSTGNLNLAVRRNVERFPEDFMFRLTREEHTALLLQIARTKTGRGGRQTPPYVFTEHGVAMLSAVLNSERAVRMSILIVRVFVKMRELLASHKDLAARVEKLEAAQKEHSSIIGILAEEIDEMKRLPEPATRRIGFKTGQ